MTPWPTANASANATRLPNATPSTGTPSPATAALVACMSPVRVARLSTTAASSIRTPVNDKGVMACNPAFTTL